MLGWKFNTLVALLDVTKLHTTVFQKRRLGTKPFVILLLKPLTNIYLPGQSFGDKLKRWKTILRWQHLVHPSRISCCISKTHPRPPSTSFIFTVGNRNFTVTFPPQFPPSPVTHLHQRCRYGSCLVLFHPFFSCTIYHGDCGPCPI